MSDHSTHQLSDMALLREEQTPCSDSSISRLSEDTGMMAADHIAAYDSSSEEDGLPMPQSIPDGAPPFQPNPNQLHDIQPIQTKRKPGSLELPVMSIQVDRTVHPKKRRHPSSSSDNGSNKESSICKQNQSPKMKASPLIVKSDATPVAIAGLDGVPPPPPGTPPPMTSEDCSDHTREADRPLLVSALSERTIDTNSQEIPALPEPEAPSGRGEIVMTSPTMMMVDEQHGRPPVYHPSLKMHSQPSPMTYSIHDPMSQPSHNHPSSMASGMSGLATPMSVPVSSERHPSWAEGAASPPVRRQFAPVVVHHQPSLPFGVQNQHNGAHQPPVIIIHNPPVQMHHMQPSMKNDSDMMSQQSAKETVSLSGETEECHQSSQKMKKDSSNGNESSMRKHRKNDCDQRRRKNGKLDAIPLSPERRSSDGYSSSYSSHSMDNDYDSSSSSLSSSSLINALDAGYHPTQSNKQSYSDVYSFQTLVPLANLVNESPELCSLSSLICCFQCDLYSMMKMDTLIEQSYTQIMHIRNENPQYQMRGYSLRNVELAIRMDLSRNKSLFFNGILLNLLFHIRNSHSLLGIVFYHRLHPYDWKLRFCVLMVSLCVSVWFFAAFSVSDKDENNEDESEETSKRESRNIDLGFSVAWSLSQLAIVFVLKKMARCACAQSLTDVNRRMVTCIGHTIISMFGVIASILYAAFVYYLFGLFGTSFLRPYVRMILTSWLFWELLVSSLLTLIFKYIKEVWWLHPDSDLFVLSYGEMRAQSRFRSELSSKVSRAVAENTAVLPMLIELRINSKGDASIELNGGQSTSKQNSIRLSDGSSVYLDTVRAVRMDLPRRRKYVQSRLHRKLVDSMTQAEVRRQHIQMTVRFAGDERRSRKKDDLRFGQSRVNKAGSSRRSQLYERGAQTSNDGESGKKRRRNTEERPLMNGGVLSGVERDC